ncbi:acyl carrier protein [Streptomyces sp. PKU-MA01144]|uniref:acyl carrier protein n=1 Tax=Streptomyces sp. PKU-MA01144 TaxID=2729138 RepID=UPI00147F97CD|nr:acyl carrier protein [Streptomyces sp. PKU-MA01144]NNJ05529.1 acyl carrier protein [Streptomyces sp. PKU-MA01144]
MAITTDENFAKIKEIVCEILELEEEEVTAEGLFNDEYGADSLRAIEILGALEREFGVVIEQAELVRMTNLQGVYDVLAETAGWTKQ